MADPLTTVVQRMIDAGESEDNIATVIRAQQAPIVPSVSSEDMLTGRVGRETGASPIFGSQTAGAVASQLEPLAHPKTVSDFGHLLMLAPVDATRSAGAVIGGALKPIGDAASKYGGAAVDLASSILPARARSALQVLGELKPTSWNNPLTVAGREARSAAGAKAFNELPLAQQMDQLPASGPAPTMTRSGAPPYQSPPAQPPSGVAPMTDAEYLARAGHPRGQFNVRPVTATLPSPVSPMVAQRDAALKTALSESPSDARMAEWQQKFGGTQPDPIMQPSHPLQGPRLEQGAQRAGAPVGLTKEDVRQVVGPRLDESRGEASPVMPDKALRDIVDTMKALPPGADREAYVARATSGKTRWQVENIRRTLEHLGLMTPLAIAPAVMHRQAMVDAVRGGSD